MAGWIRIDRDIRLHWIWSDPLYYKWWTDLLMEAAWEDTSWYSGNKSYPLKRGQLAASVSYLRERWSYTGRITSKRYTPSPNTVLNFLKKLEKEGMIKRYCDILPRAITVIEIVNYPKYQDGNITEKDPPNNSGNNGGNNSDCKHINNINNNTHIYAREKEKISPKEQWRLELEKDNIFWEQSAMSFHCPIDWLKSLLPTFHSENIACEFNENTFNDYRRDFFNFARRENQNRMRNANQSQSKSNSGGRSGGSSASIGGHGLNE